MLWRLPGCQHPNAAHAILAVCALHNLLWGKRGARAGLSRLWSVGHFVCPETATGSRAAPTGKANLPLTTLTSHLLQLVRLKAAPFHNFLKHFLSQIFSFIFFSFPPSTLSMGLLFPLFRLQPTVLSLPFKYSWLLLPLMLLPSCLISCLHEFVRSSFFFNTELFLLK